MLTVALVVATALVGLLLAHRVSGRLGGVPGVVVLAVLPWLLPAAVLVPVVSLALGRWWTGAVGAVLAAGLLVTVGRRGVPRRIGPAAPAGVPLRLMTANLYLGRADAAAVVALVRTHAVDVLSVQELTPGLARRLDEAGLVQLLPHRVVDARPHAAGSAVYTRLPLTELAPVRGARCALPRARVHLDDDHVLDVTAVHLTAPVDRRLVAPWVHEAGRLGDLPDDGVPSVLAGDFNATLDHPVLRRLLGRGFTDAAATVGAGLRTTWRQPGLAPPLTLDHVLLRGAVAPRWVRVEPVAGTDHRAVVTALVLG